MTVARPFIKDSIKFNSTPKEEAQPNPFKFLMSQTDSWASTSVYSHNLKIGQHQGWFALLVSICEPVCDARGATFPVLSPALPQTRHSAGKGSTRSQQTRYAKSKKVNVFEWGCFCTCVRVCLSIRSSCPWERTGHNHSEDTVQIYTYIKVNVCVCIQHSVCTLYCPLIKMANGALAVMRSERAALSAPQKPKWPAPSCHPTSITSHSSPPRCVWHHQQLLGGIRWLQQCQWSLAAWKV